MNTRMPMCFTPTTLVRQRGTAMAEFVIGAPLLVAVSAPTSFALEAAQAAGLTLVAIGRDDSFEIFTHPERIAAEEHVA